MISTIHSLLPLAHQPLHKHCGRHDSSRWGRSMLTFIRNFKLTRIFALNYFSQTHWIVFPNNRDWFLRQFVKYKFTMDVKNIFFMISRKFSYSFCEVITFIFNFILFDLKLNVYICYCCKTQNMLFWSIIQLLMLPLLSY